ncbi:hypothetical protein NHX12_012625 [Muraenolepis orangiensis]|nr:hypothetical protein NHX12_012625 [Muraenolepis orangiensis]
MRSQGKVSGPLCQHALQLELFRASTRGRLPGGVYPGASTRDRLPGAVYPGAVYPGAVYPGASTRGRLPRSLPVALHVSPATPLNPK